MEKKKNPKADLEKSRGIFFLIGLVIAMGGVFAAFNVSTTTSQTGTLEYIKEVDFESEDIPLIRDEIKKEVIVQPKNQDIQELLIVDNEDESADDDIFIDSETNEDDIIDYQTQVLSNRVAEEEEDPILNFASEMPKFPGGEKGLMTFIFNKVIYPPSAREQGIEGKVYVRFCVTKTGKVEKVSIARGADPILDKEALRVVKMLPNWQPGENGGRKVSVWYTVPINFQIK